MVTGPPLLNLVTLHAGVPNILLSPPRLGPSTCKLPACNCGGGGGGGSPSPPGFLGRSLRFGKFGLFSRFGPPHGPPELPLGSLGSPGSPVGGNFGISGGRLAGLGGFKCETVVYGSNLNELFELIWGTVFNGATE